MRYSSVKSRLYLVVCVFAFSLILGAMKAGAEVCFLPTVGANGSCSGSSGGSDSDQDSDQDPRDSCEDAGLHQTEVECKGSATYDSERSYCVKEGQCWSLKSCSPGYNKENLCKTALQNDEMISDSEKAFYECVESEQCYNYKRKECVASEGKYLSHDACISGGYECIFDSSDGCYERVSCPDNEYTPLNCANAISGKENYQECINGSKDGCLKIRDCGSDKYISKDKCNSARSSTETCKQEGQCWIKQSVTPPSDADLTLYVYYTCDGGSCPSNMFDRALPQVDIYGASKQTRWARVSDSSYETGDGTPYSIFTFKQDDIINAFKDDEDCYDDDGNPCWVVGSVPVVYTVPLSGKEVNSATLSWTYIDQEGKKTGIETQNWAWNGSSKQMTSLFEFFAGDISNVWDPNFQGRGRWEQKRQVHFGVGILGKFYELTDTEHNCNPWNACYRLGSKILTLNVDLKTSADEDRRNCIYAAVNCSGASMTVDADYKSNCFTESGEPRIFTESDDYWGNDYQTKGLCAVDYIGATSVYPNGRYETKYLKAYSQECATVKLAQGTDGYDLKAVDKGQSVNVTNMEEMVETINDVNHLRELQNYPDATLYKLCKKSNSDLQEKGFQEPSPLLKITKGSGEDYVFSDPLLYDMPNARIYSGGNASKPTALIYPSSEPVIRYSGVFDNTPLMNERNDHFVLMSPVITVSAAINKYTTSNGSIFLRKTDANGNVTSVPYNGECNCHDGGAGRSCSTTDDGYSVTSILMDIPDIIGSDPGGGDQGGGGTSVSFGVDYEQYRLYLESSSPVLHTFGPFSKVTHYSWSSGDHGQSFTGPINTQLNRYSRINFKADHVFLYKGTKEAISVPNCLHTGIRSEGWTWEHRLGQSQGMSGDANFGISSDPELDRPKDCQPISQSVAFYDKDLKNMPADDRVLYSCDDGTSDHLKAFYIFDSGFKKEE